MEISEGRFKETSEEMVKEKSASGEEELAWPAAVSDCGTPLLWSTHYIPLHSMEQSTILGFIFPFLAFLSTQLVIPSSPVSFEDFF